MDPLPYCPDDVIDSARLRGHGLTSHDIARLCRAGALHQLVRGWFATRPPRDAVDRHLLTARALTRHFDGRAVPSHHSRLLAVGLPVWRADLAVVHLTRVTDRGSRRRAGFTVHPAVDGLDAATMPRRDGVPVGVPVAVAIVQTGILNGPMDALIAADAALRAGLVDEPGISAALELFAGRTGVAPVRAALAHADARHESPGETRLAGVLRDLSLPATPQVWIRTQQGPKRVDLLLDGHAVVLEFDGAVKYRTPADTGQPDGRTDNPLFEEKEREDAIRDEHFEVVRVVWRQLADPGGIHRRILAAIARCTRRPA